MSATKTQIINRIRIKLYTNAQPDPVDLTSKLFDKINTTVALEDSAYICTNWKYSEQTFKSQLIKHENIVEMFFNRHRFINVVLIDAVPMTKNDTENDVMTHNVKIMLDALFPISFPGIKNVMQRSQNNNIRVFTTAKKTLFGKNENTYLKIAGKTQTVDNVIWMDTFVSNPTYLKARELTTAYFDTQLPKAVLRLSEMYKDAYAKLGNYEIDDAKTALEAALAGAKKAASGEALAKLNNKLNDFNRLHGLNINLKKYKGGNSSILFANVPTNIFNYVNTEKDINWTISNITPTNLVEKVMSVANTDTLVNGTNQQVLNIVRPALKNLKTYYEIIENQNYASERSKFINGEPDDIQTEIDKVNSEIKTETEKQKKHNANLNDITNDNLYTTKNRTTLKTIFPEFTNLFNNYDKAMLTADSNVSTNPFTNATLNKNFKTKIDNLKAKFDGLKTTYDTLPEFKALQKIINISVLITRIHHYKVVSAEKQNLGITAEDLNQPEFVFYDKTVEGFREFYYPSRQYLNTYINNIFIKDNEIDIFDLQDLYNGIKSGKQEPEGIDQINFLSNNSKDPRYEISLQLTVYGGVITEDNASSLFSVFNIFNIFGKTKKNKLNCKYGNKKFVSEFEQYRFKLPVQTYFDLTKEIEKIEKEEEDTIKNKKAKEKSNKKQAQAQAQPQPQPQAPALAQVPQVAFQEQAPAVEAKQGVPTISNNDYENEINRLYAILQKDKNAEKTIKKFTGTQTDIFNALNDNKSSKIKDYFSLVKYLETRPPNEQAPGQSNVSNRDYYRRLSNDAKETIDNALKDIELKLTGDMAATMPADKKQKLQVKQALFEVVKKILETSFSEMNKKLGLTKTGGDHKWVKKTCNHKGVKKTHKKQLRTIKSSRTQRRR